MVSLHYALHMLLLLYVLITTDTNRLMQYANRTRRMWCETKMLIFNYCV